MMAKVVHSNSKSAVILYIKYVVILSDYAINIMQKYNIKLKNDKNSLIILSF